MNLPNKLTVFRIFLIPVFMLLIICGWPAGSFTLAGTTIYWSRVVAMIVFAVASATDWFDGHIVVHATWLPTLGSLPTHWRTRC